MQEETRKSIDDGKPPTVIFTLMTLTNILINLDHGILPACTKQLKQYYQMNQTELGFLGSIVYLGIVLMGLLAGRLYQKLHSKLLTLGALIALELSLFMFILSSNKGLAYFCRFLTGVCQVFLLVYYPIWIDKFGFKKKTLWLTLLQICVPVGIFAGYGMTSLVISLGYTFQVSFYLQIAMVALFIVAFGLLSKKKLDSRRKLSQQFNQLFINPNISHQKDMIQPNQPQKTLQSQQKQVHHTFPEMFRKLWKSKMYFVGTMTMAIILFVSTGVQFWLTDYFVYVLGFARDRVNIAYAIVSITGPTSGCGFGGFVLSKQGGYDSPKAVYWVFIFSCIGIGSALMMPFLDNFYPSAIALWIVLFFGGAMMPGLTGIMMASVPPYLRAFGNSTGQIIKNCFGYLPAPFIYGWFNQMFDDQRAGLKMIMFWGLWAPILLGFGSLYRWRQLKRIDLNKVKSSGHAIRKMSEDLREPQLSQESLEQLKKEQEAALISEYLAEAEQVSSTQIKIPDQVATQQQMVRQSSKSQIQQQPSFLQRIQQKKQMQEKKETQQVQQIQEKKQGQENREILQQPQVQQSQQQPQQSKQNQATQQPQQQPQPIPQTNQNPPQPSNQQQIENQ